jgi:predicted AAA+ superfamily ATPase
MVGAFEPFIDRILRTENVRVYLTGSSSKLLSTELATEMRGRSLSWELFPFSFCEFLDADGVPYSKSGQSSSERIGIESSFTKYFEVGGFPEVTQLDKSLRIMVLQEYFKTLVHRDIIERHNVRHPQAVLETTYRLIEGCSSMYSINSLYGYLKSLGFKTPKSFVKECLDRFEDAYFAFSVEIFSPSRSKRNANTKKVYCVDHGLVRAVSSGMLINNGHLLENIVFTALRFRGIQPNYFRTANKREIDFVFRDTDGNHHLVQVAESIARDRTRKRETRALNEAMRELNVEQGTLVTRAEQGKIEMPHGIVNVMPAWRFLIGGC